MYEYAKSGQKQTTNNTTRKKATENVVSSKYQKSISDSMKTHFENLPGFSFDGVRLHCNSRVYTKFTSVNTSNNIIQRKMDIGTLINQLIDIIQSVREESPAVKTAVEKMNHLTASLVTPADILAKTKEIMDNFCVSFPNDIRSQMYECYFKYYGIQVTQGGKDISQSAMSEHNKYDGFPLDSESITDEFLDELFLRDQDNLLNDLNSLYATATGAELLEKLSEKAGTDLQPTIQIGFSLQGAWAGSKGNPTDECLKTPDGLSAGAGAGTTINLTSLEENPYIRKAEKIPDDIPDEDTRIILAHELIHALHAQLGVKPNAETLVSDNTDKPVKGLCPFIGSIDLDKYLDMEERIKTSDFLSQHHDIWNSATPDDVPVTGIMEGLVKFPALLEAVLHINENQIRKELGLPPRTKY